MAKKSKAKSLFEKVAAESAEEQATLENKTASLSEANTNAVEQSAVQQTDIDVVQSAAECDNDDIAEYNEHKNLAAVDKSTEEIDPLKQFKDMLPVNANAADRKKLELYDKLYNEFKAKTAENQQLTDKIVAYVDEIDSLKAEVEKLKASCKEASAAADSAAKEIESYKSKVASVEKRMTESANQLFDDSNKTCDDIAQLKEENNQLSLKIAQQAFEIATLKSKSQAHSAVPAQSAQSARQNPKAVQYSYSRNGYSSWN